MRATDSAISINRCLNHVKTVLTQLVALLTQFVVDAVSLYSVSVIS